MAKIPAMTLSGGTLSEFGGMKKAKEFRVWVHPESGDDAYYVYKSYVVAERAYEVMGAKDAMRKARLIKVEKPLAVVYDTAAKKYREVVIDKKSLKEPRRRTIHPVDYTRDYSLTRPRY